MSPVTVALSGVRQRYPGAIESTLDGVELELAPGEITALLGPSGCGKSTLLSVVAGLLPAEGSVRFDDTDVTRLPAGRRDVGVVFQRPMLFPHLNVLGNVAFGPRRRGMARRAAEQRAGAMLELVGIAELAGRRADQVSGGQAQRVALARALAAGPRVLLLDEPLSALDPDTRERTRELIVRVQRQVGLTTLFVTHDQSEATEVGTRIALLDGGRIAQCGTVAEMFRRPRSVAVARFLRGTAVFAGRNVGGRFRLAGAAIAVPPDAPTGDVHLVVPEHAVSVAPGGPLAMSVTGVEDLGHAIRLRLRAGDGTNLRATVPPGQPCPPLGAAVAVELRAESLWTIPRPADP